MSRSLATILIVAVALASASGAEPPTQGDRLANAKRALEQALASKTADPSATANLYAELGAAYEDIGDYTQAKSNYRRSLRLQQLIHANQHVAVAATYERLGRVFQFMGQFAAGVYYHRKAFELRQALLGDNHPETASSLGQLAWSLGHTDGQAEGLRLAEQAWRQLDQELDQDDPRLEAASFQLADLNIANGNLTKAKPLLTAALESMRTRLHANHPIQLVRFRRLAESCAASGFHFQAATYFEQAIQISIHQNGKESNEHLQLLRKAGQNQQDFQNHAACVELWKQIVAAERKKYGETHVITINSAVALGMAYAQLKNLPEAEAVLRDAVQRMNQRLDPDSQYRAAIGKGALALVYHKLRDMKRADAYISQAMSQLNKLGRASDPLTFPLRLLSGDLYKDMRRFKDSENTYRHVLDAAERAYGKDHKIRADALMKLGDLCSEQNDVAGAENYYQQSLAMTRRLVGNEHLEVAAAISKFAKLHMDAGRAEEAERMYLQALAMRKKLVGTVHPLTAESLQALGLFYTVERRDRLKGLKLLEEGRKIQAATLPENHPDRIEVEVVHVAAMMGLGRWEEAYDRLLTLRTSLLSTCGPTDSLTLAVNDQIADYLKTVGKFAEAKALYSQNLEIRREVLGGDHTDVATNFFRLADVAMKTSDFPAAIELFTRALTIRKRQLGDDHPKTARCYEKLAWVYRRADKLDSAKESAAAALRACSRHSGDRSLATGAAHVEYAKLLTDMGDIAGARIHYEHADAIAKAHSTKNDEVLAVIFDALGRWRMNDGELQQGKELLEESLEVSRRAFGDESNQTTFRMLGLAIAIGQLGEYEMERKLYERGLKECTQAFGAQHPYTASAVKALGDWHSKMGDYRTARALHERSLEILQNVFGPNHLECADAMLSLAVVQREIADYPAALALAKDAVAIRQRELGAEHAKTISAMDELADCLQAMAEFEKARELFDRIVRIQEGRYGNDHIKVGYALGQRASILMDLGYLSEARSDYERSLAIRLKTLGERNPATAGAYSGLAYWYETVGDYHRSRTYREKAMKIKSSRYGEKHLTTLFELAAIAWLERQFGNYSAARQYYERVLEIRKRVLGDVHPDVAHVYANLGSILESIGDRLAARTYHEEALRIRSKVYGEAHPDVADSLLDLASLEGSERRFERAADLAERALGICRKVYGSNHRDTARALHTLGWLRERQGKLEDAKLRTTEALSIRRRVLGDEHPFTAWSLHNLAYIHQRLGEFALAEKYNREVLAMRRKLLGDLHPDTAWSFSNLAYSTVYRTKSFNSAAALFEQAFSARVNWSAAELASVSEAEALLFVQSSLNGLNAVLSVLQNDYKENAERCYRHVWLAKAQATRAIGRRRLRVVSDDATDELWERLRIARRSLAQLALSKSRSEKRRARLIELNREKERLERAIAAAQMGARESVEERPGHVGAPTQAGRSFTDLIARLPAETAVVDFIDSFDYVMSADNQITGNTAFHAFVLRSSPTAPGYTVNWIPLGPGLPIRLEIAKWRRSLQHPYDRAVANQDETTSESPGQRLRKLLWEPIEQHLQDCNAVVVIPDGTLTRVPWAALPGKRPGTYLIEDYAIGTAIHGHHLYRMLTSQPRPGGRLLAAGGIQYDHAPTQNSVDSVAGDALVQRGPAQDFGASVRWPFLKGTLPEVQTIGRLWKGSEQAEIVVGASASERSLRQRMPRARYVHLATHGFFSDPKFGSALQRDAANDMLWTGSGQSDWRATVTGRNPLILSGVVLAGADAAAPTDAYGARIGDDGILTAEEVVDLDLSGTELVVLSACETGLGEVAGGEGVFGLQRAFHLAGARTVLASLWKVHDDATKTLMTEFYTNLWQKKMSKLEALRTAQLTMLKRYDVQKSALRGPGSTQTVDPKALKNAKKAGAATSLPPFYWAAFMLSGDWR